MNNPLFTVMPASRIVAQTSGGLPRGVTELVGTLPDLASPAGVLFYAAWGVLGIAGGKKLLGSRRSGKGPAPTVKQEASEITSGVQSVGSESTSEPTGSKDTDSGFGKSVAFTLPAVLPVSKGIREVTTNEVHALELGAIVGFITVWLLHIGRQDAGFGLALVFIGGSLGYKRYQSKAFKTIRMEPWYAVMAFAFGATAGSVFFDATLLTQYF